MIRKFFGLLTILALATPLAAQHHDHAEMEHEMKEDTTTMQMSHVFSRNLPMNRNGSGTAWMPDSSPMYAWMKHSDRWMYMLHGAVFFRYNMQNLNNDYRRGGRQFDVPNWFMGMAQRQVGDRGLLMLRGMISLDPLTVGGAGYPLLFQTGETWKDQPLVDKQHPHDLFAELGVGYTHMFNEDTDLSLYIGYPGEPALGPTAFMHRISTMNNPDAPLGHHWQDASHITFGVATIGFRYKMFKVEGSSFTGREPDENRYDFDKPRFDSYSYRVSANPGKNLSLQFSQGYLTGPETIAPDEDVVRTTASALHSVDLTNESFISTTLAWGYNDAGGHHKEHSVLLESNLQVRQWAVYGRFEWVEKSSEELQLTQFEDDIFDVNAFTIGANYQIPGTNKLNIAVGAQATFNNIGPELTSVYGENPMSAEVYLRLTPTRFIMTNHH